jgi:iron complex outermembrane receptor protein
VRDSFINVDSQMNRGIDATAQLRQELPEDLGDLSILAQMTWQFEDKVRRGATDTTTDNNGRSGEPIWVGNFDISWKKGEWSALWGIEAVQHTSDIAAFIEANGSTCVTGDAIYGTVCRELIANSKVYHSFSVTREFEDWNITLGIANILDEDPPRVSTNNLATITTVGQSPFTSNYDYFGRRGFFSVTKKF